MSRPMTLPPNPADQWLPDMDLWDTPDRLTDADIHAEAGPGWRRTALALDDPEDDR